MKYPVDLNIPLQLLLLATAAGLVLAALLPFHPGWVSAGKRLWDMMTVTKWFLGIVIVFSGIDVLRYYLLLSKGKIGSSFPVPPTLFLLVVLVMNAWRIGWETRHRRRVDHHHSSLRLALAHGLSLLLLLVVFPLLLLLAYGGTDFKSMLGYDSRGNRVGADCIIVYGARVQEDGDLSLALADRVRHAALLYRKGYGRYLVMSGGSGENGVSEPVSMKNFAVSLGVPARQIVLDENGVGTYRSVLNVKRMMEKRGWRQSLSVSHYYHLLRIKLAAARVGLNTYTVPARMSMPLRDEPWFLIREVAALYYYFFFRWGGTDSVDGWPPNKIERAGGEGETYL